MRIFTSVRIAVALVGVLLVAPFLDAERVNQQITVTAGTPIRVTTIAGTYVNRLFIQSRHANTGVVYVLMGVKSATACDATNTSQLTAELGPGDATHPGGTLSDPQGANGNTPADSEDASMICIDGTNSGDVVIVSFWHQT